MSNLLINKEIEFLNKVISYVESFLKQETPGFGFVMFFLILLDQLVVNVFLLFD